MRVLNARCHAEPFICNTPFIPQLPERRVLSPRPFYRCLSTQLGGRAGRQPPGGWLPQMVSATLPRTPGRRLKVRAEGGCGVYPHPFLLAWSCAPPLCTQALLGGPPLELPCSVHSINTTGTHVHTPRVHNVHTQTQLAPHCSSSLSATPAP